MRFKAVLTVSALLAWQVATAADMDDVRGLLEKKEELQQQIVIPDVGKSEGGRKAEDAAQYARSKEFRDRVNAQIESLKKTVFGGPVAKAGTQALQKAGYLASDERVYIFISSSIPLTTLRNYALDADILNDPNVVFVLRGFIGGMKYIKPTAAFIEKVLIVDPDCTPDEGTKCAGFNVNVVVDPLLFRRYGIDRVPAVVYAKGVLPGDTGQSEGIVGIVESATVSSSYGVSGDASLAYVLSRIGRQAKSAALAQSVRMLEGEGR